MSDAKIAENTRTITDIRQQSQSPECECRITRSDTGVGKANFGTLIWMLIKDVQQICAVLGQLRQELNDLKSGGYVGANPTPAVPPQSPFDGAILKQPGDGLSEYYAHLDQNGGNPFQALPGHADSIAFDEHGPAQPAAVQNYHRKSGG